MRERAKVPYTEFHFDIFPASSRRAAPVFSASTFSLSLLSHTPTVHLYPLLQHVTTACIYSHFDTVTPRGNCRRRRSQRAAAGGARGVLSLSLLFAPRQWQDERAAAELFPARRVQARQKKNSAATPPPLGHFGDFRAKRVSSFVRRGIDCFVGAKRVGHPRERRKG